MAHPLPSSSSVRDRTAVPTRFNNFSLPKMPPDTGEVRLDDGYEPLRFDVICAKGNKINSHVGNNRLRVCIDMCVNRYVAATTRSDKTMIIREILDTVHAKGGRFLRREAASMNQTDDGHVGSDNQHGKLSHKRREADASDKAQFVYFVLSNKRALDKIGKALRAALQQQQKTSKRRNSWTAGGGSDDAENANGNTISNVAAAQKPSFTLVHEDLDSDNIETLPLDLAKKSPADKDRGQDDDDIGRRPSNHKIVDAHPSACAMITRRNSWHAESNLEANKASDSTIGHEGLSMASDDCSLSSQAWNMNDLEETATEGIVGSFDSFGTEDLTHDGANPEPP